MEQCCLRRDITPGARRASLGSTPSCCTIEFNRPWNPLSPSGAPRRARIDPELLCSVKHHSAQALAGSDDDPGASDTGASATTLVNPAVGLAKSPGERLCERNVRNLNPEKVEGLSVEPQTPLQLLLAGESLSERIRDYNERIEQPAQERYPNVARLSHVVRNSFFHPNPPGQPKPLPRKPHAHNSPCSPCIFVISLWPPI